MRAKRVTAKVRAIANRLGCSVATVWKWKQKGCTLSSKSVQQFLLAGRLPQKHAVLDSQSRGTRKQNRINGNADLIGTRGAPAALQRLEQTEERAFARLQRALEGSDQFQTRSAAEFYLKTSECLRRMDLGIEIERRKTEEQVSKQ